AVLRTRLPAILHALQVERAPDDVVAHAGEILHAAAADQHDRVLLQVVPLAADIRDHLEAVGEAHLRNLAQRRVRLLRSRRVDARADAAPLRAVFERRALAVHCRRLATLANELVDRGHLGSSDSCRGRSGAWPAGSLATRPCLYGKAITADFRKARQYRRETSFRQV